MITDVKPIGYTMLCPFGDNNTGKAKNVQIQQDAKYYILTYYADQG